MGLLDLLKLSEAQGIDDLDHPAATELHRALIEKKPLLKKLYVDFYSVLCEHSPAGGRVVELGSGGGFLKELRPDVITSDVIEVPGLDMIFSALDMPFEEGSVDAFVMVDVFHHLPDAELFLSEADRCLKPGGRIVMIEPANTAWGRFIYKNFHHEGFDTKAGWKLSDGGPLSNANGALPWIVFQRDRELFNRKFSGLDVVFHQYHTPFAYLASGGFTLKQLLPSCMFTPLRYFEAILFPLSSLLGMFQTIVVEKKA
jgi:SAM-dependent methyltransferase